MNIRVLTASGIAVLAGLAAIGAGSAASAATTSPDPAKTYIVNCLGTLDYKPKQIVFACGDGGVYFGNIKWTKWDNNGATGVGTLYNNVCVPDCGAGNVEKYTKVKLSLGDSASGPGFGTFVNTFTSLDADFKGLGPAMANSAEWQLDNAIRD